MSKLLGILFGFAFGLGVAAAFAWVVQQVFNYVSAQFHGPQLGFWTIWGCLFLLGILGNMFRSTGAKAGG